MADSDNVTKHLTKLEDIANQLIALGDEVKDATLVSVALNTLSKKFSVFVTSIEVSRKLSTWKMDELSGMLLQEE